MAWRPSKALRNFLLEGGSFKMAMHNAALKVYTGAQPATAEAAPTGTLLVTYSDASGALTREVRAYGSVELTAGSSGSVDTVGIKLGSSGATIALLPSAVSYATSLANTAALVAAAINNNPKNVYVDASVPSGAIIRLTAKPGTGSVPNSSWEVVSTVTTLSKTDTNFASGVTAANGLLWDDASAGAITKRSTQTWSGVAVATGTAGWFRIEASVSDAGTEDTTESVLRVDGSVATSGAELNMTPTSITSGATQTISSFSITLPIA